MGVKRQVLNKLKSKKGSALLLAMFFSLICIILGMVVLAAGETANGRIVNAAKAEQSYFIAESLFREFAQETSHLGTVNEAAMTLRMDTAQLGAEGFDINDNIGSVFVGQNNRHRLTTLKPFVATALYKAMLGDTYENVLTFTMGGEGELGETIYTATVRMTMQPEDYSIYLDITKIRKGIGDEGEDVGVPNLHTIAIQCRRVTPLSADSQGKVTDAVFEYYPAKYVQNPAAEG